MKKQIKNIIAGAAVLGVTSMANAVPTMSISDGTSVVTIVDNVGSDINPLAGAVSYNGSIGTWSLIINTGLTKPVLGSASVPTMDLSIQATSTGAGNLYIAFSDTSYTLFPAAVLATITGHVASGSPETVGYSVYGNPQNVGGTVDASGNLQNGGTLLANIPTQNMPILASATGTANLGQVYGLTEFVTLSSRGPTTTSIDASFQPMPDGGMTMAMLGFGLVAVETARRKLVKA